MIVIGVTGGIGSGKSLVCRAFHEKGIAVIDADSLAKELMNTNLSLRKQLQEKFGNDVFAIDSTLNKTYLAEKVFANEQQLALLNSLVHPVVRKELEDKIFFYENENKHSFIIIEAALIFEAHINELMDYILVVDAEEELRIQRVMKRDSTTREKVIERMKRQMPAKEKREYADFVLESNGTKEELKERVDFFYNLFKSLSN
ncbi:MAG: dephospho-CoA kinase [Ignavibacteriales bacterium]|nr:dephospho-CoA kinase [Ignavibacteriales bacterium]